MMNIFGKSILAKASARGMTHARTVTLISNQYNMTAFSTNALLLMRSFSTSNNINNVI